MNKTLAIFVAAAALALAALWARNHEDEVEGPPPPTPIVPRAAQPRPPPAPAPAQSVEVVAPTPAPEPIAVASVLEPEAPVVATLDLFYGCHGKPDTAEIVRGDDWKGTDSESHACYADVDVFGACNCGQAEPPDREAEAVAEEPDPAQFLLGEPEPDLSSLTSRFDAAGVLDVRISSRPKGLKVYAWSMAYSHAADCGGGQTTLDGPSAQIVGEVTRDHQLLDVSGYEGMVYGVIAATDITDALTRLRSHGNAGDVYGSIDAAGLGGLPFVAGPVDTCSCCGC